MGGIFLFSSNSPKACLLNQLWPWTRRTRYRKGMHAPQLSLCFVHFDQWAYTVRSWTVGALSCAGCSFSHTPFIFHKTHVAEPLGNPTCYSKPQAYISKHVSHHLTSCIWIFRRIIQMNVLRHCLCLLLLKTIHLACGYNSRIMAAKWQQCCPSTFPYVYTDMPQNVWPNHTILGADPCEKKFGLGLVLWWWVGGGCSVNKLTQFPSRRCDSVRAGFGASDGVCWALKATVVFQHHKRGIWFAQCLINSCLTAVDELVEATG